MAHTDVCFSILLLLLWGLGIEADTIHLCYMYYGPINDLGYTFTHNRARKELHERLQTEFPEARIISDYVENVATQNHTAVVDASVAKGCQIIIATSQTFADWAVTAARRHRNVTFAVRAAFLGNSTEPNLIVYGSKPYIGWYQAGIVAGSERQSCIAMLVSMHHLPLIVSSVNAFTMGIQSVLGSAERVHVMDLGTWFDETAERVAAAVFHKALKCDIVAHYTDSFQVMDYASANGQYGISMNNDASWYYGDSMLTSVQEEWMEVYHTVVRRFLKYGHDCGTTLFEDSVKLASLSPRAQGTTFKALRHVPHFGNFCPRSQGREVCLTDDDIRNMTTLHPGVVLHPRLSLETCGPRQGIRSVLDTNTKRLVHSCLVCPEAMFWDSQANECEPCADDSVWAECTRTMFPAYGIVLLVVLPTAVLCLALLGLYLFNRYKEGRVREAAHVAEVSQKLMKASQEADNVLNHSLKNHMADAVGLIDACLPPTGGPGPQPPDPECPQCAERQGQLRRARGRLQSGMEWCKNRLLLMRLMSEDYRPNYERVDLQRFAAGLLRGRELHVAPFEAAAVLLDAAVCRIILENAVNNALRHGHADHPVRLHVALRDRPGASAAAEKTLVFRVVNRADPQKPRVTPEFIARALEERGVQFHYDRVSDGLGLRHIFMAASILHMEASLTQEDETVTFKASARVQTVPAAEAVLSAPSKPDLVRLHKAVVVCYIDDSEVALMLVAKAIERRWAGSVVHQFGRQVIEVDEFMEVTLQQADIAILDQNIQFDKTCFYGTALSTQLLELGFAGLVCIRSANTSGEDIAAYKSCGAHFIIDKSVPVGSMVQQLEKAYLSHSSSHRVSGSSSNSYLSHSTSHRAPSNSSCSGGGGGQAILPGAISLHSHQSQPT